MRFAESIIDVTTRVSMHLVKDLRALDFFSVSWSFASARLGETIPDARLLQHNVIDRRSWIVRLHRSRIMNYPVMEINEEAANFCLKRKFQSQKDDAGIHATCSPNAGSIDNDYVRRRSPPRVSRKKKKKQPLSVMNARTYSERNVSQRGIRRGYKARVCGGRPWHINYRWTL